MAVRAVCSVFFYKKIMKKITKLFTTIILLLLVNSIEAQNLIPNWNAQGRTGIGTEGNKWGFAASTPSSNWEIANGGHVRYRDFTNVTAESGGTISGREFLYRWEGDFEGSTMSLGLPTDAGNTTGQNGIPLEGGKAYRFLGNFEWINNAGAPTYEFAISDAASNGNIVVTKSYTATTREVFYPLNVYFIAPTTGVYYIQLKQTGGLNGLAGGLIGLTNLSIEDTEIVEVSEPYLARGTKTLTTDGTWCWFQDPRALYYKGEKEKTYSGWITSDGKIQVASYNHKTGEVIQTTIKEGFQVDDHNNPTFLVRQDGRIMVSYSGHFNGPMRVIVSKNPEDITSFGPEATFGTEVTYANPYQIGDSIYMFYRDGSSWHPSISISNDGGLSWRTPQTLIKRNASQKRPYVKYTQDSQGGMHITFTTGHPRQEASNYIYYVYFKDNKFYKADGTFIKNYTGTSTALDIDAGEPEVVYNASNGKGWTWDIGLDENDNPVILYTAFPDDYNHNYYYAKWDGSQWNNHFIVNSGTWFPQTPSGQNEAEPNYSGGMSLNPENIATVYLSKQVNGVFEIYKYETPDSGETWETEAITQHTPSDILNVRPVVPRNHKPGTFDVMWMRGKYITYQNYLTAIMYYSPIDEIRYYDFGTQNSALDDDAIRVTANSNDNGTYGFANITGLSHADESQTNASQTDYVSGILPATFNVTLFNGTYNITVVQGTYETALSGQTLKANGTTVLVNGVSNAGAWKTHTFEVEISNGLLELEISNANGGSNPWVINSLLIDTQNLSLNGLNILKENESIFENNAIKLGYNTFPLNVAPEDITWRSENTAIATVDAKGVVTALTPGSTKIYASTQNGSLTDFCTITVNPIALITEDIIFDFGTSSSVLMTDAIRIHESSQLNGSYGWVDASGILSRDRGSSNTNPDRDFVLTSTDKEFQVFLENGTYRITTTHGDSGYAHDNMYLFANNVSIGPTFSNTTGNYTTNEFDISVSNQKLILRIGDAGGSDVNWVWNTLKLVKTGALSMDSKTFGSSNINVYPNPVQNILRIATDFNISCLNIYDALGRVVMSKTKKVKRTNLNSIDVSTLSSGYYILQAKIDNKIQVFKFLK